jgi:hypothetical protein
MGIAEQGDVSWIRLYRPETAWRERFKKYVVFIDGQKVGRIRAGEELEFTASPGTHRLSVKVDPLYRSPELTVTLSAGDVAKVVANHSGGTLSYLRPSRYIILESDFGSNLRRR